MRFGMISSPVPGHIHPMSTLGRALKKRGHETFFFNIEDTREKISREGHEFVSIGNSDAEFPAGSWEKCWVPLSKASGLPVVLKTIRLHTRLSQMMIREIPSLAKSYRLDGLLIDQVQFQGKAIAAMSNLPFISVACALHMDRDLSWCTPPSVSNRKFGRDPLTRFLNRMETAVMEQVAAPLIRSGNEELRKLGIRGCDSVDDSFSELAQIFPMPRSADFPSTFSSTCVHYVGSFIDEDRPDVAFDFSLLDGRPLVYASLGTLQNGMHEVYRKIAEGCRSLPVQVVLALGQWRAGEKLPFDVPSNVMVVNYAPQLELLKRASFVITHAGMNTAYEALSFGVPMVAIPITNDQPAVARRLEFAGAARIVSVKKLTSERLRCALSELMNDSSYRVRAQALARDISECGGVQRAAEIVEKKFREAYAKR